MDNLARLAGIAVDYLIMAVIRHRNPSVITSSCMAEEALRYVYSDWDVSDVEQRNMADEEGMVRHVEGADMRPFASRMGEIHDSTKKAYQDFLRSDVTDSPRELAWAFVRLSQLDEIYRDRTGIKKIAVENPRLASVASEDEVVEDILNMFEEVPWDKFKVRSRCVLNPRFSVPGGLSAGADLVIDNLLIDLILL